MGLISRSKTLVATTSWDGSLTTHFSARELTSGKLEWPTCLAVSIAVMGREGKRDCPEDLLSDDIRIMARFDFEAAVVGPQVNRYADASDTALIDLRCVSAILLALSLYSR